VAREQLDRTIAALDGKSIAGKLVKAEPSRGATEERVGTSELEGEEPI
jgi:hypothetical protein